MIDIRKKKILILGAGTWQVPHILKAKELGLITYVTDWSENAEGKKYADEFRCIDLKNKEATLAFARESQVDAIYTSADIGVQTAAYVAHHMQLKYHSQEVALNATNKRSMRTKSEDLGISIPSYFSTDKLSEGIEKAEEIGFPVIIKPIDNFSSRGVSVVNSVEELSAAFEDSLNASFQGMVLVEEFMTGTESSVEALVKNGKPYIMGICDKEKSTLPYRYDLQLNYPGRFSAEQNQNIHQFIDDLVKGFEIQDGIIHVEIMVNADSVKLIEFAVRGCGSEVITHLMPKMLDFDVVKYLILDSLGIDQEIYWEPTNPYGVLKFVMLDTGIVKDIEGIEKVKEIPEVVDFDIEVAPGDEIGLVKDGRSRPGYLLAVGQTREKLDRTVEEVMNSFHVEYV